MQKTRFLLIALLGATTVVAGACGNDQPSAQDVVDEAKQTGQQVDERTEGLQEGAEDLGEAGKDVVDDVADGTDASDVDWDIVDAKVEGTTARVTMKYSGFTIVAADGDTSGNSGHFHVFIDREPVKQGETIPQETGIIHSAANPIEIPGLTSGEHKLTVVLGDGNHVRIRGDLEDEVTVKVP